MGIIKYAIYVVIFSAFVIGAYYSGYSVGSRDIQIECANKKTEIIIQEKEVIKYVEKEKDKIYSRPNAAPSNLVKLFNEGKL
jgi:hypothetical protein